ncbi:hypothetical protein [Streptomyces sp. YGL11-2]|uniref:hypothetical protein n=1 Tax=Streptomyces sp. YGL11-2 TaxID=3414028 RepID=UPI003CF5C80F
MPPRHPNLRLAALLSETNWSAGKLARAVNGLGAAQGLRLRYDRTSVAHWLAGSRPRPPVPHLVAETFSRHLGRPISAEETGLSRRPASGAPLPARPEKANAVHQLLTLCRQETDPERRGFLVRSLYSLSDRPLPAWDPSPPRHGSEPPPPPRQTVVPADAETLQELTHTFEYLSERHGGTHVRLALICYLAGSTRPLLAGPAPRSLHRDLLTGTAQLTHLLATMTADAGHPGLAQRYFHIALALSRQAAHRVLYAITLRAMSRHALQLGYHSHAGDLARAAVHTAGPRAFPAAKAYLLAQRAVIHAHERRPRLALADLAAAERHHEQATSPAGPFSSYARPSLNYQQAHTLQLLGDRESALVSLRAATHRDPDRRRSYALTQARLAETLLEAGHLEAACSHWHTFLDHYPHLHSAQVERALGRLREDLRCFPRQPRATALRERARTLARPKAGQRSAT